MNKLLQTIGKALRTAVGLPEQSEPEWSPLRINVGREFSDYLVGRDSAAEFADTFLIDLDRVDWWFSSAVVVLDFSEVRTLAPTWLLELLWYYAAEHPVPYIRQKIRFVGLSKAKQELVEHEFAEFEKLQQNENGVLVSSSEEDEEGEV